MSKIKMFIITLSCAAVMGCASYGKKIDASYIEKIKKGETTEQQIIANLGNPMSVGITPDGKKFLMYMYTYSQAKASTCIPIVGAFAGGADTSTQMLQVWVDNEGVVINYSYTNSQSELNTGVTANQP